MPLGSVFGLPFIPMINDTFGRRWTIMFGSVVMIIGTFVQGFAINGTSKRTVKYPSYFLLLSPKSVDF